MNNCNEVWLTDLGKQVAEIIFHASMKENSQKTNKLELGKIEKIKNKMVNNID